MNRLLELLDRDKLTLIVSLPENSPELAAAAIKGGADALKVHCNIKHRASGVSFGSLSEEKAKLSSILRVAGDIPVGIVPGAEKKPSEQEAEEIVSMGFDFLDMMIGDMPDFMFGLDGITKIAAVDNRASFERLVGMSAPEIKAIEAAIIPHLGYGQNLTIGDLQYYITLATISSLPVIVPTQRKISTDEVPILSDTGVKSLMIGAIVTGSTPMSIEAATASFRNAIDSVE